MVNASKHYALDLPTVIKVALIALFALSLVILTEGLCDECREDDQVCCSGDCFHGSSCLGLYCSSDLNCSRGQSCCSNACVNEPNCGLSQNCSTATLSVRVRLRHLTSKSNHGIPHHRMSR